MPLFSIALIIILLLSFPFHARYMNLSATTMKALGGTLFIWGMLFALQRIGENGTIVPELAIILPVVLLFLYAFYTYGASQHKI
jgi:lipopolysaccharide export system permease protein